MSQSSVVQGVSQSPSYILTSPSIDYSLVSSSSIALEEWAMAASARLVLLCCRCSPSLLLPPSICSFALPSIHSICSPSSLTEMPAPVSAAFPFLHICMHPHSYPESLRAHPQPHSLLIFSCVPISSPHFHLLRRFCLPTAVLDLSFIHLDFQLSRRQPLIRKSFWWFSIILSQNTMSVKEK